MTTWNSTIPNPANVPANDATSMQQNFSVLDTAFNVDHVNLSLLTAQGFHKQISYSNVGASPYTVSGSQSYEYAKFLASNVRTYLEYQPAGPDTFGGNPAIVPLSFKSYCVFDPTGVAIAAPVPPGQFKRRFNVASVTRTTGLTFVVAFNENMPDAFFSTFFSNITTFGSPNLTVSSQAANSVTLSFFNSTSLTQTTLITVAVM